MNIRSLFRKALRVTRTERTLKKIYHRLVYAGKDYLEAYADHTDKRVSVDPQSAIGAMWEEIGRLQFEFLRDQGLEPESRLLDIGCGTLRGGRHAIAFLAPNNYIGIDLSPNAIAAAKETVEKEGLSDKRPALLVNERRDLTFREFSGQHFDFVLAQSVFTHLKPDHIEECLAHIGGIMHQHSKFYFTYNRREKYTETSPKDFCYPQSFFTDLALKHHFHFRDCSSEYLHPRGQLMVELQKVT